MQLELHQIDTKYKSLRVTDRKRWAYWTAHLLSGASFAPVTVVKNDSGRYTLIDGYLRCEVLHKLARDTVEALILPVSEDVALVRQLQMEGARGRSALEEGWWLQALVNEHGRSLRSLGEELCRSTSWVSRRLALVQVLPESVQAKIRTGKIPTQGAAKYLVPLSRDNSEACHTLVDNLNEEPVTVRQLAQLYRGWRGADEDLREHIITAPWTYLNVVQELSRDDLPVSAPGAEPDLLVAFEQMTRYARQVRRRLIRGELASITQSSWKQGVHSTWAAALDVLAVIAGLLHTEAPGHARSRNTDSHPSAQQPGPQPAPDSVGAEGISQERRADHQERCERGATDST